MKKILFKTAILGLLIFGIVAFSNNFFTPTYFDIPAGFPKTVYDFTKNPLSKEGFQLGRKLFYDPILSKDSTISCASCHLQQTGFAHVDHDLSHGIEGKIGSRNALTLQNLAWSKTFMYDGGIHNLELQPLNPITSAIEMNETMANVVRKLQTSEEYQHLFFSAFGTKKITGQLTLKALAQFVVSLTSANSKYDKVKKAEQTFTEIEQKGYALFKQNCTSCHKEPLFTTYTFENNGLDLDPTLNDYGRMKITQNPKDSLRFKVPTLRNIEFTAPYMHDGRFKTLQDVIKHYSFGIKKTKILSGALEKPMNFSDRERTELVAFLKTLSDKEFLFNPKFNFPK